MTSYKPLAVQPLGQRSLPEAAPTLPDPDLTFMGFTGLPGILETLTVLAVTGAAAWTGIQAAQTKRDPYAKAAGWIGGVGSALFGLLYLGSKTGVTTAWGLPAVRVSPA